MCQDAILEVIVVVIVLVVSMVAKCSELHKLSCSELCLDAVEEEAVDVVLSSSQEFVHRCSYMGGDRECVKVPKKLMILGKLIV